jgi:Tfp pilus assembly protein PilN
MRAVNLIPVDQRAGTGRGPVRSQGAAYAVLGLLGGLALLAVLYGIARHQISTRRAQSATLTEQAHQSEAEAAQLAPYTSFIALRQQRVQAVLGLVDSRFDWAHALHELGRVLPRSASISSLSGSVGSPSATAAKAGASLTSATPPGSVPIVSLTGCATSQTEVARTLDRLRLIDGVSDVTLASSTKTAVARGGAASAGAGECANGDAVFTVQVSFAGLPAATAFGSAAVSSPASAGALTGAAR